ncbi:MAG TPA: double zinc ribbon domain-containing protein [Candidatus Limnocylindria bacterium]|nr:double zinc ribbon domain-containing protein [Candidatus Limnocylindria bacterium]
MQHLLDVLLPPTCPGCGREGEAICATCRRPLTRRRGEPAHVPLGLPSKAPAGIAQLEWCAAYNGPARDCLHALKYDGETRLVEPLAELMAQRWRSAAVGGEVLVPVPVHAARRRQRGFDQAELLARAISRRTGLALAPALERAAATAAQHNLGRRARAGNVGSAFAVTPGHERSVRDRWVVLVDDIVTTGATAAACALALRAAGAAAVSALAFARER